MSKMTPYERWVARTMLARGFEPSDVEDALGLARYGPAGPTHRRRPSGRANPVTADEIERMIEMRAQGMSCTRIGVAMGRDHSTVSYWLRKMEMEGTTCADTWITTTDG